MFCKITSWLGNYQFSVTMKFVVSIFGHSRQSGMICWYEKLFEVPSLRFVPRPQPVVGVLDVVRVLY